MIFKVIDIVGLGGKDQCGNLNQNSYFELTPEDQLAVTFICNQYLYVYRICMRPHIIVSLDDSSLVKEASIVIEGKNRFDDGFMPAANATIHVRFTNLKLTTIQLMVSGLLITIVGIMLYLMFFYEYGRLERMAAMKEQEPAPLPVSPVRSQRVTFSDEVIQRKVRTHIQDETEVSDIRNSSFIS